MIHYWVDGGMLGGRNPSPIGVFWSVARQGNSGGCRVVVEREESHKYHTNNEAEWLALRSALLYAKDHDTGEHELQIHSDSLLVVNQFNRTWRCKRAVFVRFFVECRALAKDFPICLVSWSPREIMLRRLGH